MEISNFLKLFEETLAQRQNDDFCGQVVGKEIRFLSGREYQQEVALISKGLHSLSINHQDSVGILAASSRDWHLFDMAAITCGFKAIPVYPTLTIEDTFYILHHAEVKICFVDTKTQLEKIKELEDRLPQLKAVVTRTQLPELGFNKIEVLSLEELKRRKFEGEATLVQNQDTASIIYTSGTTGVPKGAVITHQSLAQMLMNCRSSMQYVLSKDDINLAWLPLSHVFGRCDSLLPFAVGNKIVFARSLERLLQDIQIVRPTFIMAVPRVFEKIYSRITSQVAAGSTLKKSIFNLGRKVSEKYYNLKDNNNPLATLASPLEKAFYKIVFSKVNEKFGGRLRFFVSGGAPLNGDLVKFFKNCHLTVLEGYGLTETVAPCCLNPYEKTKPGFIGKPLGDVEMKIAKDGEILIKTKSLFKEYYKDPIETAKAIRDGWFYSGDIGKVDSDGYFQITDRKKEIIVTAAGKNVAPQKIENKVKAMPFVAQFVVLGDKQKFLTGIIGLDQEELNEYGQRIGVESGLSLEELAKHEALRASLKQSIEGVNKELADFEKIKDFHVSNVDFSVDAGLLTPSLKVKRRIVLETFAGPIEQLYS